MSVIGLPTRDLLAPGTRAEFTVFEVEAGDLRIADSMGDEARLRDLIEPQWTIMGPRASRRARTGLAPYPSATSACPTCGWVDAR